MVRVLAVLVTFLMVWLASGYLGVKVLVLAIRPTLPPLVPIARIANTSGSALVYQHATETAASGTRSLARMAGVALGMFMALWPISVIVWFFSGSHGLGSL